MAIYKKVAKAGKYQDDLAIPNLIAYITRADKAKSGMIGGVGIDPNHIADSMVSVSNAFNKNSRIRLHHRGLHGAVPTQYQHLWRYAGVPMLWKF